MSTKTVSPVIAVENKADKPVETVTINVPKPVAGMIVTPVTIVEETEIAAILHKATDSVINLAFTLQEDYENASQYRKDALQDAAVMFLKAECSKAIARWDNLVSKMTKTPRYKTSTREQVEISLRDNPKFKPFYTVAVKAASIKKQL